MSAIARPLFFGILLVCMVIAIPKRAEAITACGILCSCTVSSSNIALGNYDPITGAAVTGTGTLTVTCQLLASILGGIGLASYSLTLSQGQASSYTQRQMIGPSSARLNYNLYLNPGMTTVWGDGSGVSQIISSSLQVSGIGVNYSQPHTIYARIPAGQNTAAKGDYQDNITATISF